MNKETQKLRFWIQWWPGSFNELALQQYVTKEDIADYQTIYLYTTEKVMHAVDSGEVDRWVFAVVNSAWGLVQESLDAIGKYQFKVTADINLAIQHFLMCRKDVPRYSITKIMAHPQVFSQCQKTLWRHYVKYICESWEGDLIDTAKAAEALATGQISTDTAILWNKLLAEMYDFQIMAENLQDRDDNMTRFLVVEKI